MHRHRATDHDLSFDDRRVPVLGQGVGPLSQYRPEHQTPDEVAGGGHRAARSALSFATDFGSISRPSTVFSHASFP